MNCRTLHAARLCPLLLAIAAPTIAAEPHWDDAWQPVTGQWQAKGGEYVQSDPSLYGAWSLWTAERFANAEIRVRFQIEPVGSGVRAAGIVFRAVDNDHFFFAHFDSRNDQLLVTLVCRRVETPRPHSGDRAGNEPLARWPRPLHGYESAGLSR